LGWQAWRFFTAPEPNLFLGATAVVLIGLAVFVGNEGMQALRGNRVVGISTTEIPSRAE
jgi:carbon starvation protein